MRIVVDKIELKNAINLLKKGLPKVVLLEERGHLLCSVKADKLKISATNNDIKMQKALKVENLDGLDFKFTIDPKIVGKLLVKITIEKVQIEVNSEEYTINVKTSDNKKSVSSVRYFPPEKMLGLTGNLKLKKEQIVVNRELLLFALQFARNYLPDIKEENKRFDFVIIRRGYVYAANGSNKMGYVVFKALSNINRLKIRKAILPVYISVLESLSSDKVHLIETEKDIGLFSVKDDFYFSSLNSNVEAPRTILKYLKSKKPYTKVAPSDILRHLDRLLISDTSTIPPGITMELEGKEEQSTLKLSLITEGNANKSLEAISCLRVEDSEDSISHVVDSRILKQTMGSFKGNKKEVRLHINEADSKFFRVFDKGEINSEEYAMVAVVAYSRVIS